MLFFALESVSLQTAASGLPGHVRPSPPPLPWPLRLHGRQSETFWEVSQLIKCDTIYDSIKKQRDLGKN